MNEIRSGDVERRFMGLAIDLEEVFREYDLESLETQLKSCFPEMHFSFREMMEQVISGNLLEILKIAVKGAANNMSTMTAGWKNIFLWLVMLGILSALLSVLADIFDKHQISDLCFYITYLLLSVVALKTFRQGSEIAVQSLENITSFMKIMMPVYLVALGAATGSITVSVYYQLYLILMFAAEKILISGVIPLVNIYCMMAVVNGIWTDQKLSMLMELTSKMIGTVLRLLLGLVTGIGIFQSLIAPVVDSVKGSAVRKVISAIPGIGNTAGSIAELIAGSAAIIKNSLGIVILLLLFVLCISPLLKILVLSVILKSAAALMGIVSDKRISRCTDHVGEGSLLILKCAGTGILMFVIMISVAATAANKGF